jgi:hypothetical protein
MKAYSPLGIPLWRWCVILVVLWFVICIAGCSDNEPKIIDSILYDQRPAVKMIVVEKSPWRVSYIGSITQESRDMTNDIMKRVSKYPYYNHKFNPSYQISVSTSGMLSDTQNDNADVNLQK